MLAIGFIGFGEAASSISLGLSENENVNIYAYDILATDKEKRPLLIENAAACNVTLTDSLAELAGSADIIFSAVTGSVADKVADEMRPHLNNSHVYVDLNTITPEKSKKIAKIVEQAGAVFIDGAMMSSLKYHKHKVPTLVSGRGVNILLKKIAPLGMNFEPVGEEPGTASGNKLIRSLFSKGFAALIIETLICAQKLDSYDVVLNSIVNTLQSDPSNLIDRLVTGTMLHSRRRLEELFGSKQMLQQAGMDSRMIDAIIEVFRSIDILELDKKSITDEAKSCIEKLESRYLHG
jgi:3-hydroxyisobutyrate dehydrogenase-like beta-hydroxyacid dehydrogenase